MSKKIIYNKHLEKGRFYHRSDSNGGHPALIISKNDRKNIYEALVFTSSHSVGTVALQESIDITNRNKRFYVHEKTFIGKRRDFGKKILTRLRIGAKDKQLIKLLKK